MKLLPITGILTLVIAIVGSIGCENSHDFDRVEQIERDGQPSVAKVDDDDAGMNAAIEKARSTVDEFISSLENPGPTQIGFSVKVRIEEGEAGEHMWILPVRHLDGKFFGTINNKPVKVTTVKIGDEVEVAKDQISDWMYIENQKLIGGYTFRALRDRLSGIERDRFDRNMPFQID